MTVPPTSSEDPGRAGRLTGVRRAPVGASLQTAPAFVRKPGRPFAPSRVPLASCTRPRPCVKAALKRPPGIPIGWKKPEFTTKPPFSGNWSGCTTSATDARRCVGLYLVFPTLFDHGERRRGDEWTASERRTTGGRRPVLPLRPVCYMTSARSAAPWNVDFHLMLRAKAVKHKARPASATSCCRTPTRSANSPRSRW